MYVVSPDVAKFEESFKQQVAFFCNTLIFFLAGIIAFHRVMYMPEITGSWINWFVLLFLFVVLILSRLVMAVALWPILKTTGYGMQVAEAKILVWAGLRGAMTVALALAMDLDQNISRQTKDLMMFHLAGLTVLSLLVNGTTIDKFYVWLDIHPPNPYRSVMFDKAMSELECSYMPDKIAELQADPLFAAVDWTTVRSLVYDMSDAKIVGRARPEFQDDDDIDPYSIFKTMLDRRQKRLTVKQTRKDKKHHSVAISSVEDDQTGDSVTVATNNNNESLRMQSAIVTFSYLSRFEVVNQHKKDDEAGVLELIVSPCGRAVPAASSRTTSSLEVAPIRELFPDNDGNYEHVIDINLNQQTVVPKESQHHDQEHDVEELAAKKRPAPAQQLRELRRMTMAMKLHQHIARRRALIGNDDRNAQIVLTLFAALKADFREQFESHRLSHEAVWMLFDAANAGSESCVSHRPTLSQPFASEWSSLSIKLEGHLISPWLRHGQKFRCDLCDIIIMVNIVVATVDGRCCRSPHDTCFLHRLHHERSIGAVVDIRLSG